jgi:hypothetical protein
MLGVLNIEHNLKLGLMEQGITVSGIDELPEVSALFIDWITKDNALFGKQAVAVEHYVKAGIPIVIFDRHFSLTQKEYSWLNKFNVTFLEPAVNNRLGFEYLPQWIKDKPYEKIDRTKRTIDLAYSGILTDRIKSFEKYFKEYAGLFPEKKVCYSSQVSQKKIDKWQDSNMEKTSRIEYGDVSFTILIGSQTEYRRGYIRDDLFDILNSGCVPLLPLEHRFFGTVFKDLIVDGENLVDYFVSCYKRIHGVLVEEIYENLISIYPEFHINYAVDRIKSYV